MSTWWVDEKLLDKDQRRVVTLDADGRYGVSGPPGSGKTNLLIFRANFLQLKKRPDFALLTLTAALQSFLVAGVEQYGVIPPSRVDTTVGWMMRQLNALSGSLKDLPDDFVERREALAQRLLARLEDRGLTKLATTLLIDEAQDCTKEELTLFERCAPNIMLVGDTRQLIHAGSAGGDAWLNVAPKEHQVTLQYHYRNAPEICERADRFAKVDRGHVLIKPTCNYKGTPGRVQTHNLARDKQFGAIIESLRLQLDSYEKEAIGVLCMKKETLVAFWDVLMQESDLAPLAVKLSEGGRWDNTRPIVCSTVHSAKGLEFRAVHLPSFEENKGKEQRNLAYTAVTRAKTSLDIYHEAPFAGWLEEAMQDEHVVADEPEWSDILGKRKT
jgi:superfamily I DNA/RNA helicase